MDLIDKIKDLDLSFGESVNLIYIIYHTWNSKSMDTPEVKIPNEMYDYAIELGKVHSKEGNHKLLDNYLDDLIADQYERVAEESPDPIIRAEASINAMNMGRM